MTPIDTSEAAPTVSVVDPLTAPCVAIICVAPGLAAITSPVVSMEAMAGLAEFQATSEVMSRLEPSVYRPVAVNWRVKPTATLMSGGPTAIAFRRGGVDPLHDAGHGDFGDGDAAGGGLSGRWWVRPLEGVCDGCG